MHIRLKTSSAALLLVLAAPLAAVPPPVADFARPAEFGTVKLSPDGRYLAVTVPTEDRTGLAVLDVEKLQVKGVMNFRDQEHVSDFWWSSDTRVIATLATKEGALDAPVSKGELYAMNADGGSKAYLFGYRGEQSVGSHVKRATAERAWAYMVDPLRDDPDHALIRVRPWESRQAGVDQVYKINEFSGAKARLLSAPTTGETDFFTDWLGRVRYALVRDTRFKRRSFYRAGDESEWQEDARTAASDSHFTPLRFSGDNEHVYLLSGQDGRSTCLLERKLDGSKQRQFGCGVNDVEWSFDGKAPLALINSAGRPETKLLAENEADRKLFETLQQSFSGEALEIVSRSRDGRKLVLRVSSDRNPGDYYLFDRASKQARYLISTRGWIDPKKMGERKPISYATRDGHRISGFITLPPGRAPKSLPMVVLPHGGPFDVFDSWYWDADAQLLASRGYAVLQVNFRGSGGYGRAHMEAGKRSLGFRMIDDITDGLKYATAQGYADPARVCIYGASYGGYAALMSAVREPDLYRCAIGYAGAYDRKAQYQENDTNKYLGGQAYIREYIADSEDELVRQSPLTYIDRLKAPVLIVHGEQDKRVPFSQAKLLRAALEKRKHPYEWLSKPTEGHGFYRQKSREEFYGKMLEFLDRNIGEARK